MRRPDATRVFYGMEFFDTLGAQAAFTVWAVYLVQDVGVNPLQLVLLGTISEIAIFLFEVPTGVVADTYSRRLSIIVGMILAGLAMVIFGLVAVYWVIVLAVILRGIGGTFMSGAWEAWITDEHGVDGIGRVFLRGNQFSYLGAIVGSAARRRDRDVGPRCGDRLRRARLGGDRDRLHLPHARARLPPPARGGAELAAPRHADDRSHGRAARARPQHPPPHRRDHVLRRRRVRGPRPALGGAAPPGLGLPELWGLDPVVWFGVFNIVGLVAGIVISSFLVPRFEYADNSKLARSLLFLTVVLSISVVIFGLATSFVVAAIAYLVARLVRRLKDPLYVTWLNKNVEDSSVRATVNSIASQSDAIGEVAGGPAIGVIGTFASLRAALVATGLLLAPAIPLFVRALRHGGKEPELEEAEAPA